MLELANQGYLCSQIIIILGLEARGETNPSLVKAVGGLSMGCGEGSCTCGVLTGGCCLLALFAGKGSEKEDWNENYPKMSQDLVRWFWHSYGFSYQGIDCMAIREAEASLPPQQRCWKIMEDVYNKVMSILTLYGINICDEDCYAS
jgi:hypothetical protein